MIPGLRTDPFLNCNFLVEIEGLVVAGFSEVSGLAGELEVLEYREGGVNGYAHRLPGPVKYGNLTLRHGMTYDPQMWIWWESTTSGLIKRRTMVVLLLDSLRIPAHVWEIKGAFPVRWNGPELKAETAGVAVQSLEIAHNGVGMVF